MDRINFGKLEIVRTGEAPDPPAPCPRCHGAQWLLKARDEVDRNADTHHDEMVPCPECYEEAYNSLRLARIVGDSGLEHPKLRAVQFAGRAPYPYQTDAMAQAVDFAAHPQGWLWLYGPPGSGKSMLAKCIGNERLNMGNAVLYRDVKGLLDWLKDAFSPAVENTEGERFAALLDAPVLILDEFDLREASSWATRKLQQLMNHRWERELPTVVTTNMELNELGEKLESRVRDVMVVKTIRLEVQRG